MKLKELKKLIKETVRQLLTEAPYATLMDAKNNCWMGNGDCLDGGNQLGCTQQATSGGYNNVCGAPIIGGGTLTPNISKGDVLKPSTPGKGVNPNKMKAKHNNDKRNVQQKTNRTSRQGQRARVVRRSQR